MKHSRKIQEWTDEQAQRFFHPTLVVKFIGGDGRFIRDAQGEGEMILPVICSTGGDNHLVHREGWEHISRNYPFKNAVLFEGAGEDGWWQSRVEVVASSPSYIVLKEK